MKDLISEDVYTIDVDRWLSRYEDDFDVCRELAVAKSGVQPLPSKGDAILLLRFKTLLRYYCYAAKVSMSCFCYHVSCYGVRFSIEFFCKFSSIVITLLHGNLGNIINKQSRILGGNIFLSIGLFS